MYTKLFFRLIANHNMCIIIICNTNNNQDKMDVKVLYNNFRCIQLTNNMK